MFLEFLTLTLINYTSFLPSKDKIDIQPQNIKLAYDYNSLKEYKTYYNLNITPSLINNYNDSYNRWTKHSNDTAISIVKDPKLNNKYALKFSINKNDNYSSILNGAPRAEISRFSKSDRFIQGKDYLINFKTYLPDDFQLDSEGNREGIFQIHQTSNSGSPPVLLGIDNNKYFIFSEIKIKPQKIMFFGNVTEDKGKWINWTVRYRPSEDSNGIFELYKDKKPIVKFPGANTYPKENGYIKFGIYKWGWNNPKVAVSKVINRTVLYSDISFAKKNK